MKTIISKLKIKFAFTLAEVLLVLAIIGIVAALTLPTLISNYQKQQYVISLKKAYTVLSQGFKLYMVDQGVDDLYQSSLIDNDNITMNSTINLIALLKKYFKIGKYCYSIDDGYDSSCQVKESYDLNPADDSGIYSQDFDFYSADGMAFKVDFYSAFYCKPDNSIPTSMKGECLEVRVDTNGASPPNRGGRDFFLLLIGPDGNVYMKGSREYAIWKSGNASNWEDWGYYWKTATYLCGAEGSTDIGNGNGAATYCAARVRDEGWKMLY